MLYPSLVAFVVAVSSVLVNYSYGQNTTTTQTNLFPFGVSIGDSLVPAGDDIASDISVLKEPITFFESQYREIVVTSNGVLSLGGVRFTAFSPLPFPLISRVALIAPFWFDLDSTRGGSISYRQSNDSQLLQRMSSLVQAVNDRELVDFHPTRLFIATWYQVPRLGGSLEMNNTFQVVLGTDTLRTVSLFIYDDIQSGSGAQIGFNAGDGITSFTLPEALTSLTLDMEQRSNIGLPGVFIYRLDNLGTVMCSSTAGCTSYDLGNTTLVDCCSESTGGMFYSFPGTQDCSPCDFGTGMVECSSTPNCSFPDLGVMTAEECCVDNPIGRSFIRPESGVPRCQMCIVFGWFEDTYIGVEQEEMHEVLIGFSKGFPDFLPIDIRITSSFDDGNARIDDVYFIEGVRFAIYDPFEPVIFGFVLRVDNVALELNENFGLEIDFDQFVDRDGLFYRRRIEVIIVDSDVLDISFGAPNYEVEESSDLTVEVCTNNAIANEAYPIEVLLSTLTLENLDEQDNPVSPNRADAEDFQSLSDLVFYFFPDEFLFTSITENFIEIQCQQIIIDIVDDNVNEANQTFVVTITLHALPEFEDLITMSVNVSHVLIIDNDDIDFKFEQPSYTFTEPPIVERDQVFLVTDNVHQQTEQTFIVTFEALTCNLSTLLKPVSFEEDLYAPQSIVHIVDPNSIQRTQYDFDLFPDNVTEVAEYLCLSSCVSVLDQQFDQPCQYYAETTIVIVDPATPIGFSRSLVTIRENDGAVSIYVFSYTSVEDLVINFTTYGLNATSDEDFERVDMPVHFVNDSDFVVIAVNIVDDDLTEGVEMFSVVLTVSDPADPTQDFNSSIIIQILDNDNIGVCGNTFMGRNCSENAFCYLSEDNRYIQDCSCKNGYIGMGFICQDIDECSTGLNNCSHNNADCNNTDGSFECRCKAGYVGDGVICIDSTKQVPGPCNNSQSYCECTSMSECGCLSGFEVVDKEGSKVCQDINECEKSLCDGTCVNTIGSFNCFCPIGFAYDSSVDRCLDLDECRLFTATRLGCSDNADCMNTAGSYECRCKPGFYGDGRNCFSTNQCSARTDFRECGCQNGYYFEPETGTCEDVNECKISDNCDKNAECVNTIGSYTCSCYAGFIGNGMICNDINECELGLYTEVCDENAVCMNDEGSFTCRCQPSYFGDGRTCERGLAPSIIDPPETPDRPNHDLVYPIGVDFCLETANSFPQNVIIQCQLEQSVNPLPSLVIIAQITTRFDPTNIFILKEETAMVSRERITYEMILTQEDLSPLFEPDFVQVRVTCTTGNDFGGDEESTTIRVCTPSECQDGFTNNCTHICTRTNLTEHECSCNPGFELSMDICSDVDECAIGRHNCSIADNERCENEVGSYRCECVLGFARLGESCEDINECEESENYCSDNERCVNTIGSFSCLCEAGYTRMNGSGPCQNVNECLVEALNNCSNSSHRECRDTPGSFMCPCKSGFEENDVDECEDVKECDINNGNCSQLCNETDGSFYCYCEAGYHLDDVDEALCHDIDECVLEMHDCDTNAVCINTIGSFDCICDQSHEGDGKTCQVSDTVIIGSSLGVVLFVVIIGVVLVLVGVSFWCVKRSRTNKLNNLSVNEVDSEPVNIRGLSVQSSYKLKLPPHLILPSTCIKLVEPIGQGEFGIVYKGYLTKNQGQVVSDIVAIKTLKGFYDSSAVKEMLKECAKMYTFNHPNVLTLRGVCVDGGPAPYIIMPFMANGSLLAYLKKERAKLVVTNEDSDAEEVESVRKQLIDMCIQIARGMEYVARKKVVHRDLAARNCMIDVNFVIKVADFGLCESLETKEYFRQDKAAAVKLPVKWLAPESMEDYVFSEKSDVWAYGVTCWEIFSGGKVPYPNVDLMELPKLLRNGLRLDRPENGACNEEMYTTMLQCWEIDADKRPTFSALVDLLSKDLEVMANYMDLQSDRLSVNEVEAEQESSDQLEHSAVNLIDSSVSDVKVTVEESNYDETHI